MFFPIFLLTAEQAVTEIRSALFLDQFFVTLFAAACGLFATVALPRPSGVKKLDTLLSQTVETTRQILPLSLASVLELSSTPADSLQQQHLARDLRETLPKLKRAHNDYCAEFTRGPLAPAALRGYIKALQRIQRNSLLGPTSHVPGERIKAAMEKTYERNSRPGTPRGDRGSASRSPSTDRTNSPILSTHVRQRSHLIGHLTMSTQQVSEGIRICLGESLGVVRSSFRWTSAPGDECDLEQIRKELGVAVGELQRRLSSMMDELSASPAVGHRQAPVPYRDRWRIAFYVVALIDLARDVDQLLDTAITLQAQMGPPRLFLPFTKPNHRSPPEPLSNGLDDNPMPAAEAEKHLEDLDFVTATLHQSRLSPSDDSVMGRVEQYWRQVWDQKAVLRGR